MTTIPRMYTLDISLGCPCREAEHVFIGKPGEFGSRMTEKTHYSLNLMRLEQPNHGHVEHTMTCPACGKEVQLRVNSRQQAILATYSPGIFGIMLVVGIAFAAAFQKPVVENFDKSTAIAILLACFGVATIGAIGILTSIALLGGRNFTQMSVRIASPEHEHMLFDPEGPRSIKPWK